MTLTQAWDGTADCLNCSLRSTALFGGLTKQDFEHMHEPVEQIAMKPGEVLYSEGDPGHHMFTVRSGLIKLVQYLPDGTQRIVRLMRSTDVLGLEVLVGKQYEHEAVVLRNSELCRYPKEVVDHFSGCGSPIPESIEGCRVVDLGCGTGSVLADLAPHVARVIGVDSSGEMLEAARQRTRDLDNVELHVRGLDRLNRVHPSDPA